MLPFKIAGKQSENTPIFGISVKQTKTIRKTFMVQVNIFYQMPAGIFTRGAAAFKDDFGFKSCGGYNIGFKKTDGQKRNCFKGVNILRPDAQRFYISLIKCILLTLIPERLKGKRFKIGNICVENIIFPVIGFEKRIQVLII
jgi:hypothetical protein